MTSGVRAAMAADESRASSGPRSRLLPLSRPGWGFVVGTVVVVVTVGLALIAGHLVGAMIAAAVALVAWGWERWVEDRRDELVRDLGTRTAVRTRPHTGSGTGAEGTADGLQADGIPADGLPDDVDAGPVGGLIDLRPGDVLATPATTVGAPDGLLVDDGALAAGAAPRPRRVLPGEVLPAGTMVLRGSATVRSVAPSPDLPVPPVRAVRRSTSGRQVRRVALAFGSVLFVAAPVVAVLGALTGRVDTGLLAAACLLGVAAVGAIAVSTATLVGVRAGRGLLRHGVTLRSAAVLDRVAATDLVAVGTPEVLVGEDVSVDRVWTAGGEVAELARVAVLGGEDVGDPLLRPLLSWATALGVDAAEVRAGAPALAEVPWDSGRRRVTTAHPEGEGVRVVSKGAPEAIWPLLVTSADGVSAAAAAARPVAESWAAAGLRVVAVATTRRTVAGNASGRMEWGLRLLGLVGLSGGGGGSVREAVAGLRAAGVDVALLSPEHEATALAVATGAGVVPPGRGAGVLTGEQLAAGQWAADVRVLARMSPEQHREAVARWRTAGRVVALTGSTIPETGALLVADVAMSVGRSDEAARAASDVHMAQADLRSVLDTVRHARWARSAVRLVLGVAAAFSLATVILSAAALVGGQALLYPAQAVLVALAVVVPAGVGALAGEVVTPALPVGAGRPAAGVIDVWWWLWALAWGLGAALPAWAAGAIGAALGAVGADLAPGFVVGVLVTVATTGAHVLRPGHGAAATAARLPARAVLAGVLAGLTVLALLSTGLLHTAQSPWLAWPAGAVGALLAWRLAALRPLP